MSFVNSISFSNDKGKMLENIVYISLKRKYNDKFYFREKTECDFIVMETNSPLQAIQVCYEINTEN